MSDHGGDQLDQDKANLALAELKLRLDYRKFIWGSVVAAIVIATIPPLFQLATAHLERVKAEQQMLIDDANKQADRVTQQQTFRDTYVKEFLKDAMNQDIELRIRFAEYFAFVSADPYKESWGKYKKELLERRDDIRKRIDTMEAELRRVQTKDADEVEVARLVRNLEWAYKEVGYAERNRSTVTSPRDPKPAGSGVPISAQALTEMFPPLAQLKDETQQLLDAFAEMCTSDPNDVAIFLAITLHESAYFRTRRTESFRYTAEQLMRVWPSRFKDVEQARKVAAMGEEAIGNFIYAGVLGNGDEASGDGFRFRGRGYIMAVGRGNYERLDTALALGGKLVSNPDLLSEPTLAKKASAFLVCQAMLLGRGPDKSIELSTVWRRIAGGLVPPAVQSIYDRIREAR